MLANLILSGLIGLASAAMGQQPADTQPPASTGNQQDQPNDEGRRGRRREFRERAEQFRNATPEQRRELRSERYVDMAKRVYELDDTQAVVVRQEIGRIDAERRASMGADAAEYDRLRDEMDKFWASRQNTFRGDGPRNDGPRGNGPRGDGPRGDRPPRGDRGPGGDRAGGPRGPGGPEGFRRFMDDPEFKDFRELREKMQVFEQKYPFDWRASMERIEKLLPPENVAKGRAKMEERRARWQQRGEDAEQRQARRRDRDPDAPKPGPNGEITVTPQTAEMPKPAVAQAQAPFSPPPAQASQPPPVMARPTEMHPWAKYVQDFSARYELTDTQQASGQAILKDLRTRSEQMEKAHAGRLEEAAKAGDVNARQKIEAEVAKENDSLFNELKGRLDSLLTAAQRAKGKQPL